MARADDFAFVGRGKRGGLRLVCHMYCFRFAVCATSAVDVVAVVDNEAWSCIQLVSRRPVVATVMVV